VCPGDPHPQSGVYDLVDKVIIATLIIHSEDGAYLKEDGAMGILSQRERVVVCSHLRAQHLDVKSAEADFAHQHQWRAHLLLLSPSLFSQRSGLCSTGWRCCDCAQLLPPVDHLQIHRQGMDKPHGSAANPRPSSLLSSSRPSTSYGSIIANTRSTQISSPPVKPKKGWTAWLWSFSHPGSVPS